MTGKCGSVLVRLIPAPRGTGIVAAAVPKKLLNMAGVSDCYTSARGQTATLGNFGKLHDHTCIHAHTHITHAHTHKQPKQPLLPSPGHTPI